MREQREERQEIEERMPDHAREQRSRTVCQVSQDQAREKIVLQIRWIEMPCREEQGRSHDRHPRGDSSAQKPPLDETTKDRFLTDGSGEEPENNQRCM